MKKLIVIISLIAFFSSTAFSQLEVKTNPLGLIFLYFPLSVEYVINDNNGVEGIVKIIEGFGYFTANYKYYLNPNMGGDNFYIGGFLAAGSEFSVGGGFHLGYKVIGNKRVLFDIGLGIGRTFDGGFNGTGQLSIGYRFKG